MGSAIEYRVVWHRQDWTGSIKSRRFTRQADAEKLYGKLALGDDLDVLRIERRSIIVSDWEPCHHEARTC